MALKKEVRLCIRGTHISSDFAGDAEDIAVETVGSYIYQSGKHYIRYNEISEDGDISENILKINHDKIELIRKGHVATQLCFKEGAINYTDYVTVIGKLFIGIHTKSLRIDEKNEYIMAKIEYEMIMNEQKVSDSTLEIELKL